MPKKKNSFSPLQSARLFACGGLLFFGIGLFLSGNNLLYKSFGQRMEAEITRSQASSSNNDGLPYKFSLENQKKIYTGIHYGGIGERGAKVAVEYLVIMPSWNRAINSTRHEEVWHLPITIFGLIFFLIGLHSISIVKRQPTKD